MTWRKLQSKCLICNEIGPYYLVTNDGVKWDENMTKHLIWHDKHKHDGRTSMSFEYMEGEE